MDLNKNYILIAEDDEDDRMLLKSAFNEVSDKVSLVFVENGVELLDFFSKIENGNTKVLPSLLILDLNMPKMNGKEALLELKKKSYFNQLTTVIFSTTSCEREKETCHEYGVAGYFVKPTGYKALLDIVADFELLAGLSIKTLH